MQIFISWSGDLSKAIAKELHEFIPTVLQSTKPYYTPSDIDKGSIWLNEILKNLNQCKCGIVCITADNYDKPWVLFETGAIVNKFDNALVCPIFFNISKAQVRNPLTQVLQSTDFNKADFKHLLQSINKQLGEQQLNEKTFEKTFDIFYPEFEAKVNELIKKAAKPKAKVEERDTNDMLAEILDLTRALSRSKNNDRPTYSKGYLKELKEISEFTNFQSKIMDHNKKDHKDIPHFTITSSPNSIIATNVQTGDNVVEGKIHSNVVNGLLDFARLMGYERIYIKNLIYPDRSGVYSTDDL